MARRKSMIYTRLESAVAWLIYTFFSEVYDKFWCFNFFYVNYRFQLKRAIPLRRYDILYIHKMLSSAPCSILVKIFFRIYIRRFINVYKIQLKTKQLSECRPKF